MIEPSELSSRPIPRRFGLNPLRSAIGEQEVERGVETILGTEPARNAARRLLTEANATAFSIFTQGTSGREMTEGGPERFERGRRVSSRPLVPAALFQIDKQVALTHILLVRQPCAASFGA